MADHFSGLIVVLDKDVNEEDCELIVTTLKMIKGVTDVKPVTKEPLDKRIERSRIISDIKKTILEKLGEI